MRTNRGAVLRAHRRADLLLQEARRDAELVRAVGQRLVVAEVLRQPHVAEDRLLQLAVEVVELAVDVDAGKLVLDPAALRLQPVDVRLVPLHRLHQAADMHRRLHAVPLPRLHDNIVARVQEFYWRAPAAAAFPGKCFCVARI